MQKRGAGVILTFVEIPADLGLCRLDLFLIFRGDDLGLPFPCKKYNNNIMTRAAS